MKILPKIDPFPYNEKRKRKRPTTKAQKVCGEQPVIVPKNQTNLFYETQI